MNIITKRLDGKLSVTGQITVEDLAEIAAAGYQSVICNRPDYEEGTTQPASAELEKAAQSLGIKFVYLPVAMGPVYLEKSEVFNRLVAELPDVYDGYGACPLTVENGKVILAEFGFGGKLMPTFPLNPVVPRRFAWLLKTKLFPWLYWNGMLKGREWLTRSAGVS